MTKTASGQQTNHFVCKQCEASYGLNDPRWKCDYGSVLDIEFKPVFDIKKIEARKQTMWRYREAIPIRSDSNIVSFDEGFTPLVEVDFGGRPVQMKQDHLFPSGSYKDRGASVLVSKVKELGVNEVVEDSSGNAGCAVAAYCAKAEIACHIFVPESTSSGKLAQVHSYGARLNKIAGSREDTAKAAIEAAKKIHYASHSWNPFFFHGTKTFSYEICEQLGWQAPDTVIIPVGNGTLLLGVYIGFDELLHAGIVDKMPRIVAIQSANCDPLYRAFKDDLKEVPVLQTMETIAEGIAISEPIRGTQIIEAVKASNGDFIIVSDVEIKESLKKICKKGFYVEPTSAATTAGVTKYLRSSDSDHEIVVSVFTGHGLKSTEKMLKI